ncbi:MAG: universal stress protein [Roseobacter sp.]
MQKELTMAYKSIFAPLTHFDSNSAALAYSTAITDAHDAHLEVLCLGVDPAPNTYYDAGSSAVLMHAAIEEAHAHADEMHNGVLKQLAGSGLRWEIVNAVSTTASLGHSITLQARLSDLAIVGSPYGSPHQATQCLALEGLLFEAACPTVIVPKGDHKARPETIMIGWNESKESIRAIRSALPFLQAAASVHIAIIDPPENGPDRSDPGGALAVFLARHGVRCDIQVMTRQGERISDRLARHVIETGADMLVMGGYGHSRFREAVLGGATRDMLEHSTVPVLMAH